MKSNCISWRENTEELPSKTQTRSHKSSSSYKVHTREEINYHAYSPHGKGLSLRARRAHGMNSECHLNGNVWFPLHLEWRATLKRNERRREQSRVHRHLLPHRNGADGPLMAGVWVHCGTTAVRLFTNDALTLICGDMLSWKFKAER